MNSTATWCTWTATRRSAFTRIASRTFSNANGGCLSFPMADGLIGFQDDKLTQPELAAFIAGAKSGDFDHILD